MGILKAQLLLLGAMLMLASGNIDAALVAIPTLQAHVVDLTQTLTSEQKDRLEQKLVDFEAQKGSQIAILLLPSTQPEDIAQYSIRVVDVWKLGRKKVDDGVLILVAKDDHKMRIEVGYGLEGAIPDLTAKRIISETMAPRFKQGDFFGGLNGSVDQLMGLIAGEALPSGSSIPSAEADPARLLPVLFFGVIILGAILRAILGHFFGGLAAGGIIGTLAWLLGGGILMAAVFGLMAFLFTLIGPSGWWLLSGLSGGGSSRGGGPFSGGGGFGGGGASGNW